MLKQEVPEAAPLITAKYFRQNRYAVFQLAFVAKNMKEKLQMKRQEAICRIDGLNLKMKEDNVYIIATKKEQQIKIGYGVTKFGLPR